MTAWTALYYFAFERVGYVVATVVYMFALLAFFNRGRWWVNAASAAGFTLAAYLLFTSFLQVALPRGILAKADQRLADTASDRTRKNSHVLQQDMPVFGVEHDEALEGILVIHRDPDLPRSDLRGKIGNHRGWLPPDRRHVARIGPLGAIPDLRLIACFSLPDHVAFSAVCVRQRSFTCCEF